MPQIQISNNNLTVGSTDIHDGTIGRVLYHGANNYLGESSYLYFSDVSGCLYAPTIVGNLVPSGDLFAYAPDKFDIGQPSVRWENLYVNHLNAITISGIQINEIVTDLTPGAVPFVNVSGYLTDDYPNLNYNNTTDTLLVKHISASGVGNNECFGLYAGNALTTGVSNVLVGNSAGLSINSGRDSTLIGYITGDFITTGSYHTALGSKALSSISTSSYGTAIGYAAAESATVAVTAIGSETCNKLTSGTGNVGVGLNAMYYNITGVNNTCIGHNAGKGASTYSYSDNTFLGYQAGYVCTQGTGNTCIGGNAGNALTVNNYTVAIGFNSLSDLTDTSPYSTVVGAYAANKSLVEICAFGYSAGRSNVSGANNTYIGISAGYYNLGATNTCIGRSAGQGTSSNNYSSCVFIGYQAGYGITTGGANIFIGYQAGDSCTTGSGNIVLGYNCDTATAGTDNSLNIGNVITGSLATGNIGIGTISPHARLEVFGPKPVDVNGYPQLGVTALDAYEAGSYNPRYSIGFGTFDGGFYQAEIGFIRRQYDNKDFSGDLFFAVARPGAYDEAPIDRMIIARNGDVSISGNFFVNGANEFDIGRTNIRWENLYVNHLHAGSLSGIYLNPETIDHNVLLNWDTNKHVDHSITTFTAGSGLIGGGTLASNRTFDIGSGFGITVLADTIAVNSGVIDHDKLLNYSVNKHLDHTSVTFTAGSGLIGGGTLADNRIFDIGAGFGITVSADAIAVNSGVIDHDKLLNYLPDKHVTHGDVSIIAGSGLIGGGTISSSRTLDIGAGFGITVFADTIAVNSGIIDHDKLLNYLPNKHIDHSSVSIIPVSGLSGGGDLTSNVPIGLNIFGLSENMSPASGDFIAVENSTGGTLRKVKLSNLPGGGEEGSSTFAGLSDVSIDAPASGELVYYNGSVWNNVTPAEITLARTTVTLTAGNGLTGGGDISTNRTFTVGGGTGITVDADSVSTNDSQIVHDNLSGFSSPKHIDHSAVSIIAGSGLIGGGTLESNRTFDIGRGTGITVTADAVSTKDTEIDHNSLLNYSSPKHVDHSTITFTAGSGIVGGGTLDSNRTFDIGRGSGITVTADTVSTNDGEINHNSLLNYLLDKHITHADVSIVAGSGLIGGGNISSSRTLDIGAGFGITVLTDTIAVNSGVIDHDKLLNYLPDKHITHADVTLTAGNGLTGGGTISASRTFTVGAGTGITVGADSISTNDSQIVHNNLSGYDAKYHGDHSAISIIAGSGLIGGGTLESNRTLNIGAGAGITVDADTISLNAATIDHNLLLNYLPDKHIDHTTVSMVAGSGLIGGGTLSSNRTFDIGRGTGITIGADTVSTNDGEINHDALLNFLTNEHIDWTNASNNLKTTGNVTSNYIYTSHITSSGVASSLNNECFGLNAGISLSSGASNTLVGSSAGDSITSGGHHVAVGYNALSTVGTSSSSVAIGSNSLTKTTVGGNVAVGYYAGYNNTSGAGNTHVGYEAGRGPAEVTAASNYNTFIGYTAGYSITGGGSNTFIGFQSGYSCTTGSSNICMGTAAGAALTTGAENTAIGNYALTYAVSPSNCVAIGHCTILGSVNIQHCVAVGSFALQNCVGNYNTGVGGYAGYANTTGTSNTSIGCDAGRYNLAGGGNTCIGTKAGSGIGGVSSYSNNVAIGFYTGYLLTSGASNVFIGDFAGYSSGISSSNVAIGYESLVLEKTIGGHVAIGFHSLYLTDGAAEGSIAVGSQAGVNQTTGSANTYLGNNTGLFNQTGSNNVLVGQYAGYGGGGSFSNNVYIGYRAGVATTTGGNNTFVGYQAGNSCTTGSGNIVIGYTCDLTAGNTSNSLNIGNKITGDLTTGAIAIPSITADVHPSGHLYTYMANKFDIGQDAVRWENLYVNHLHAGSLSGIYLNSGTIDHDALLNSTGNKHIDHTTVTLTAGSGLIGGGTLASSRTFDIGSGFGITVSADTIAVNSGVIDHDKLLNYSAGKHVANGTSGQTLRNDGTGWIANSILYNNGTNIGIGTTSPTHLLEVGKTGGSGVIAITTNGESGSTASPLPATLTFLGYANAIKGALLVQDRAANAHGGWMKLQTADSSAVLQDRVMIDNAGNVGIGTTLPNSKLEVVGNANIKGIVTIEDTSATTLLIKQTDGTNCLTVDTQDTYTGVGVATSGAGRVYIGTLIPDEDDSAVCVGRDIQGTDLFSHAFRDESTFSCNNGSSYASYDAIADMIGSGNYGHFNAYQDRMFHSGSSTTGSHTGFSFNPVVNGGTVTNMFGVRILSPVGTGTIGTLIGLSIASLTKGSVANYAIYSESATLPSYHAGLWQTGGNIVAGGEVSGTNFKTNAVTGGAYFGSLVSPSGYYCTSIGYTAGANLTDYAQHNTSLGCRAGYALTSGKYNTLVGSYVGDNLTTGGNNILIGYNIDAPTIDASGHLNIGNVIIGNLSTSTISIKNLTSSYIYTSHITASGVASALGNECFGLNAGIALTDGTYNTCVGNSAGDSITGGDYNTFVGFQAGSTSQTGNCNVAIGYNSSASLVSGGETTVIGYQAAALSTSNYTVAVGSNAAYYQTTGASNTTIGSYSSHYNSTGGYNVCIGCEAGFGSVTSAYSNNTFIGYRAGYTCTTGSTHVAIGPFALGAEQTGAGCVAIGYYALSLGNNNIAYCVAVGQSALQNNTGDSNTGIGYQSGFSNTTGTKNTYLGYQTGYYNSTKGNNTCIGYYSGYGSAGGSYENNTYIGYGTGSSTTTGSNNIFVGYRAGYACTAGSGNLVVGYDCDIPTATTNNALNIGNTIKGDLSKLRTDFQGPITFANKSTLTIDNVTESIAVTRGFHLIAGYDDANDDLKTISGGTDGQLLIIRPSSDSVSIMVHNGDGNIALCDDFIMDDQTDNLLLIYDSSLSKWIEISRSCSTTY